MRGQSRRMYGKSTSTISSILANKKEIKKAGVAKEVNVLTKQRSQTIEDVDKLLLVWINEQQFVGDSVLDNLRKGKAVACGSHKENAWNECCC